MRTAVVATVASVSALLVLASCAAPVPEPAPPTRDPILTLGHGSFIGADGAEVTPDAAFIAAAQAYYIDRLTRPDARVAGAPGDDAVRATRRFIDDRVPDRILANAVFLDWLLESADTPELAHITTVNHALRWHYYLDILGNPRPVEDPWTKGIGPDAARQLLGRGIPATVLLRTSAGGAAYLAECRGVGVPIPQAMYSNEWQQMGVFDNEFISESSEAELWLHTSESPRGVCLALPRYCGTGDEACLLGIICLGTQSNKACFLDNPNGVRFPRGVQVSIAEFVGGVDLVANAQGTCTDCHAGENPFVVHPEKPPFAALPSLQPGAWHEPLVVSTWPQNPGPTSLLDAVPSPGKCTVCHGAAGAGRFPEVSVQLRGYCGTILATAVGGPPKRTMPPGGFDIAQFTAHIDALKEACGAHPPGGGFIVDVDLPDDPAFVSPPIVIDPCYQCARKVAVRGAILDAELELFINGSSVGSKAARSPTKEEFDVPALVAGDVITATQAVGGTVSAPSAPVTVRDHTVDFPAGLPAPQVDPTLVHECGDIIAIRHVPGATITVFSNGGDPRVASTSTDWTAIRPGKRPFDVGDTFTAEAELCGDVSPRSGPQAAVPGPASIPAPTLKPTVVYGGQELVTVENIVYGARVLVREATFGDIGSFTWPVSWFPDFDVAAGLSRPLAPGEQLIVAQELCSAGPTQTTEPAGRCPALPAPRIRHPVVGEDFVVVTEFVPGARIRVYDQTADEIGDGAGAIVMLKRPITATDILTVVQQLGECRSSTGYQVGGRARQP